MRQGCGTLAGRPTPPDNRMPRENNSRRALCLPGVFCWVGFVQSRGRAAGRPPPTAAGKRAQPVSAAEPPGLRPAQSLPSPGFSWVIAGLRLFCRGLRPAAAPCKPQGYGPQGRPPQAAVGGRAESPPPKNRPSDGLPCGPPRTDPPGLPHQLLPHGLQQPLFPPGDLHLRHPELPGHLGLGLAAVVPQKNQPAVPFLQIGQQLVQRKQVA